VLQRTGNYPVPPGASDIPGLEVAGVIDRVMQRPWRLRASRSVTASVRWWPVAAMRILRGACGPVPAGAARADDIEAASLPETFFTVWSNVFDRARLQAGETLLVQGGSSGIGVTAIQMAQGAGCTRDRHGRQRRQMRRLCGAGRRPRHQLQDARLCAEEAKRLTGGVV
jgi:NADPH2:quinone reductase